MNKILSREQYFHGGGGAVYNMTLFSVKVISFDFIAILVLYLM